MTILFEGRTRPRSPGLAEGPEAKSPPDQSTISRTAAAFATALASQAPGLGFLRGASEAWRTSDAKLTLDASTPEARVSTSNEGVASSSKVHPELSLRVSTEHLGELELKVARDPKGTRIELCANTAEAFSRLSLELRDLHRALTNLGLEVSSLRVKRKGGTELAQQEEEPRHRTDAKRRRLKLVG